jgi:hypothetical protein
MINRLLTLTFAFLLFACNSKTAEKLPTIEPADSSVVTLTINNSERFVPERKGVEKFDTILADRQIQIIITKTDLDSYVKNEYDDDGRKQIDKYRDAEIALIIKQNSQTLIDTVFRKNQFSKYADNGFMDIAIFHNYWFNKLNKNKIELFGVINEPETDYSLAFYHYFDLTNGTLHFVEYIDEEE